MTRLAKACCIVLLLGACSASGGHQLTAQAERGCLPSSDLYVDGAESGRVAIFRAAKSQTVTVNCEGSEERMVARSTVRKSVSPTRHSRSSSARLRADRRISDVVTYHRDVHRNFSQHSGLRSRSMHARVRDRQKACLIGLICIGSDIRVSGRSAGRTTEFVDQPRPVSGTFKIFD
jgi:hypothetical protein